MNLEDRWLPRVIKDEWSGRMSCGRQTMCVLKIGISYYYGNKHKMLDGRPERSWCSIDPDT